MSEIVGKKFIISTKQPRTDQYTTRTIHIAKELVENGKRMYLVKERGKENLLADADIYDQYFLIKKGQIHQKGYKGATIGGYGVRVSEY